MWNGGVVDVKLEVKMEGGGSNEEKGDLRWGKGVFGEGNGGGRVGGKWNEYLMYLKEGRIVITINVEWMWRER